MSDGPPMVALAIDGNTQVSKVLTVVGMFVFCMVNLSFFALEVVTMTIILVLMDSFCTYRFSPMLLFHRMLVSCLGFENVPDIRAKWKYKDLFFHV